MSFPGLHAGSRRREFLSSCVAGSLLMPGILSELLAESPVAIDDPLSAKTAPFSEHGQERVIFVFSNGGVSHMDTFDYKPALFKADGKVKGVEEDCPIKSGCCSSLFGSFRPGGTCGTLVSDLFPHLRQCMDDICLIRSMNGNDNEHYNATLGMHTGSFFFSRPSIGSWVSYGLGTQNQNLPSFIALAPQMPYAGTQIFNNDFLPAYHQGVRVLGGSEPIANLKRRSSQAGLQELELGLADVLNNRHMVRRAGDGDLSARIRSFETAFHMQVRCTGGF